MIRAHIPARPGEPFEPRRPGEPWRPGQPSRPGEPFRPGLPGWTPPTAVPAPDPVRVWADPHIAWQDKLYEQLLARRIVLASGQLDDEAAARLSAQLLTLDAEAAAQPEAPARSAEPAAQPAEPAAQPAEPAAQPAEPAARPGAPARPVRLELQNLHADLTAVITVMGILDVMRVPVHCVVSGEVAGPALGLLASCPRRTARPNAVLTLTEPKLQLSGTATAISACEQQVLRMLDTLYYRLAEATGRPADEIREDARRGRMLTAAEAIGYGLIQAQEDRSL